MGTLSLTKRIAAPPPRVFDIMSDFENAARNVPGIARMEVLTNGPIGVGTRFAETRVMFGKERTEEMEITDWRPGEGYTMFCESCGCEYESRFSVVADGSGTLLTMDMHTQPVTLMAKVMSPVGKLFMGTMKKCIDGDMEAIRAKAEEGEPDGVAQAATA